jgi:hypothetical protein
VAQGTFIPTIPTIPRSSDPLIIVSNSTPLFAIQPGGYSTPLEYSLDDDWTQERIEFRVLLSKANWHQSTHPSARVLECQTLDA